MIKLRDSIYKQIESYILQDGKDFTRNLVTKYIELTPHRIKNLHSYVNQSDLKKLIKEIHELRTSCQIIGALELERNLKLHESNLRAHKINNISYSDLVSIKEALLNTIEVLNSQDILNRLNEDER